MFDKPFLTRRTNKYKGDYVLEQKDEILDDIIAAEKSIDLLLDENAGAEVGFLSMKEIAGFQIERADSLGGLNSADAPPVDENLIMYNRACVIEDKSNSIKKLYIAKQYFDSYGILLKQHDLENSNSRVLTAGVMVIFSDYPEYYIYLDDDGLDISIAKEVKKFGVLILSEDYKWENIDDEKDEIVYCESQVVGRNL